LFYNHLIRKSGEKMAGKFELKMAKNGKFHFNLKAGNGQIILSSEMYNDKSGAKNGIASVAKNGSNNDRFERKTSAKQEPYFVLKAGNGEVIGKSEMYKTAASMEKGVASVMKNCEAKVVDTTDKNESMKKPAAKKAAAKKPAAKKAAPKKAAAKKAAPKKAAAKKAAPKKAAAKKAAPKKAAAKKAAPKKAAAKKAAPKKAAAKKAAPKKAAAKKAAPKKPAAKKAAPKKAAAKKPAAKKAAAKKK
jgi:uncharacterized protein YegP (UPF0339 family)